MWRFPKNSNKQTARNRTVRHADRREGERLESHSCLRRLEKLTKSIIQMFTATAQTLDSTIRNLNQITSSVTTLLEAIPKMSFSSASAFTPSPSNTHGPPFIYQPILPPGTPGAPYFDGHNASDFMRRYETMICRAGMVLNSKECIHELPYYCEQSISGGIELLKGYETLSWTTLTKAVLKQYKHLDEKQQMYTHQYLGQLVKKQDTSTTDYAKIRTYLNQFSNISSVMKRERKISDRERVCIFVRGLPLTLKSKLFCSNNLTCDDPDFFD